MEKSMQEQGSGSEFSDSEEDIKENMRTNFMDSLGMVGSGKASGRVRA